MRHYALYVVVYGVLGFFLERLINLVVLGSWLDNSLLFGPYQLMYGIGVTLSVIAYGGLKHIFKHKVIFYALFFLVAILITGLVEHTVGTLHRQLYSIVLWDYRMTFTLCTRPFTCFIPTGLFGILAGLTVVFVHGSIKSLVNKIPAPAAFLVLVGVGIDIIITYAGGIQI